MVKQSTTQAHLSNCFSQKARKARKACFARERPETCSKLSMFLCRENTQVSPLCFSLLAPPPLPPPLVEVVVVALQLSQDCS